MSKIELDAKYDTSRPTLGDRLVSFPLFNSNLQIRVFALVEKTLQGGLQAFSPFQLLSTKWTSNIFAVYTKMAVKNGLSMFD